MSEIRVNGVSLYYEEHGAGEAIVGIHGAGSSAAFWSDAARELARHGRAIVYDRRGCSRSERPEPYATNVHQQADDAAALMELTASAMSSARIEWVEGGHLINPAHPVVLRPVDEVLAVKGEPRLV